MRMARLLWPLVFTVSLLNGCGGGSSTPLPPPPPPPTATGLTVTAVGASVNAGAAFNVTVNAVDGTGVVVPSYAGTVHFTSTDAQAVLPADAKLSNGTGTFPVTLKTAGGQAITATDTTNAALAGSFPIRVNPGSASQLSINVASAVTTGLAFGVTVSAVDGFFLATISDTCPLTNHILYCIVQNTEVGRVSLSPCSPPGL
jgi:hypothetical protein